MEKGILDTLIQAGGVALVAGIFLWYLDRENKRQEQKDKRTNELIGNHLKHSTDAMERVSIALTKLTTVMENFIRYQKRRKENK